MKSKTFTTQHRLKRLENVTTQLFVSNKMLAEELSLCQQKLKIGKFADNYKDEEE